MPIVNSFTNVSSRSLAYATEPTGPSFTWGPPTAVGVGTSPSDPAATIVQFTSSGWFRLTGGNKTINFLLVGGGGSSPSIPPSTTSFSYGGGGGGGVWYQTRTFTPGLYPVTVGGAGSLSYIGAPLYAFPGFGLLPAPGGGASNSSGGSGGGGSSKYPAPPYTWGSGLTNNPYNPVSPGWVYGRNGGRQGSSRRVFLPQGPGKPPYPVIYLGGSGGGGGHFTGGGIGGSAPPNTNGVGGSGGSGVALPDFAPPAVYFGSGGGGGGRTVGGNATTSGGGHGANSPLNPNSPAQNGIVNTGGGGGGKGNNLRTNGSGGSGVVYIRFF